MSPMPWLTAHAAARKQVVRLLSAYRDVEELVQIMRTRGSNPRPTRLLRYIGPIGSCSDRARLSPRLPVGAFADDQARR